MAFKLIKYWLGSEGPFLMRVNEDDPEVPFRFENVQTRVIERVVTERTVFRENTITELDAVTAAEYSAFRAAHFNAFKQGS